MLFTIGVWVLKKKRLFRWLALSTCVWLVVIATPMLPNMVINSLESQYKPLYIDELTDINDEFHIVILGAGHGFNADMPANTLLSQSALSRLNEGIRLHRQLPNSKLVLSGYSTVGGLTSAEMMGKAALLLGVNKESIILQNKPVDTYEEAVVYAENYGIKHPMILVTSAVHMPRAMWMFEEQGINPIASPTDFKLKGTRRQRWFGFPELSNIEKLNVGIYQYAAIAEYALFKSS